jgi:hypothetical protein
MLRRGCWRVRNPQPLRHVHSSRSGHAKLNGMTHVAMEGRKQAVSIRLNAADVRNLRKLSRRLGVRNSDIIRYAIKNALTRLSPLCDSEVKGRALVPALVDAGGDLMRYLDLDIAELESIINEGAAPEQQVDRADVQLLAVSSPPPGYARLRLVRIGGGRAADAAGAQADAMTEENQLGHSVRKYFYDKYVYTAADAEGTPKQSGGLT